MNLLLDTHAFIWFVENDKQLPEKTKKEIENEANIIFVSVASLWEITIKLSLGKLVVKSPLKKIIKEVADNGFELLPILPEHLLALNKLEYHHRDPFDRAIIAQSSCEELAIVSIDLAFDSYKIKRIWG
ncbi:MAG: twitching motility protein PilT [Bacteroidota bacterium]|nr:twitching motility protein PilT [Bacteroidota bacterium]